MLLMILFTDLSDSLYINAVNGELTGIAILAAFIPLIVPVGELGVAACCNKQYVGSHLLLLQCVASPVLIFFHAFVSMLARDVAFDRNSHSNNTTQTAADRDVLAICAFISIVVAAAVTLYLSVEATRGIVFPQYESLQFFRSYIKRYRDRNWVDEVLPRLDYLFEQDNNDTDRCLAMPVVFYVFFAPILMAVQLFLMFVLVPIALGLSFHILILQRDIASIIFVTVLLVRSIVVYLFLVQESKRVQKETQTQPQTTQKISL